MKFKVGSKTYEADVYLVIRNGEVWDVRVDAGDYEVYDGEITDDMESQYVDAIIALSGNNVVKEV